MALSGAGPKPEELARHLLELVRWLERDMDEEETRLLAWLTDSAGQDQSPGSSHGPASA